MAAGAGYNVAEINEKVGALARAGCAYKAECADLRAWLDRISTDADPAVVAAALKAKVVGDGGTISDADALKLVNAILEFTYWAATFVPTHTVDVRGPSSLV